MDIMSSFDNEQEINRSVKAAIAQIMDSHFRNPHLRQLLDGFVDYKLQETSIWWKLTIYTHYMLGGSSPHIFHAAAQTELIILSLDILDDLQDQDNFTPPWMSIQTNLAMNAATALLTSAITGCLDAPLNPTLLKYVSTAHNGQHDDIRNLAATEEEYLQIVKEKSASLVALAMHMGYQLTESKDAQTISTLLTIAECIGIAAQLDNDTRSIAVLDSNNDIVCGKTTMATLYLKDHSEFSFPLLPAFIHSWGVLEYSASIELLYAQEALRHLDSLVLNPQWKERFQEIAINPFLKKN